MLYLIVDFTSSQYPLRARSDDLALSIGAALVLMRSRQFDLGKIDRQRIG